METKLDASSPAQAKPIRRTDPGIEGVITIARNGIDRVIELERLLADAVAALAKAGKRHRAGGHIRLDAQGILAVRAVLEDYAAAIAQLPARTMIRCHRLTEARIASILAGKRLPHDVEVMDL